MLLYGRQSNGVHARWTTRHLANLRVVVDDIKLNDPCFAVQVLGPVQRTLLYSSPMHNTRLLAEIDERIEYRCLSFCIQNSYNRICITSSLFKPLAVLNLHLLLRFCDHQHHHVPFDLYYLSHESFHQPNFGLSTSESLHIAFAYDIFCRFISLTHSINRSLPYLSFMT